MKLNKSKLLNWERSKKSSPTWNIRPEGAFKVKYISGFQTENSIDP